MTKGMKAYERKARRSLRRKNHITRDLNTPKYYQRVREGKPNTLPPEFDEWDYDDDETEY